MRFLKVIFFFIIPFACDAQTILETGVHAIGAAEPPVAPVDTGSAVFTSYAEFMDYAPALRFQGWNPVISNSGTYTNICPGGAIIDPADPTKYLLYVGEHEGNTRVHARVSMYRGVTANPILGGFTSAGVVLEESAVGGDPDDEGAGFGSVLQVGDTVYQYYTGISSPIGGAAGSQTICLAVSLDGETFTKKGQVLIPDEITYYNFTDPTVYYESGTWYMYVTGKSVGSLPNLGIICYTSSDGYSWTHQGVAVQMGSSREFDGKYIEGAGFLKAGSDYILFYTTSGNGDVWSNGIAHSTDPLAVFTSEPIAWFQHGAGSSDATGVAVSLVFNSSGDNWYIFYQGTAEFQPASIWDLCAAKFVLPVDDFPLGYIDGRGGWTGDGGFFETTAEITISPTEDRTIRALRNSGFSTVIAEHATDVTPAANSSYNVIMRSTSVSAGNFIGGYYVYEGSTQITGLYFNGNQLKYLTSSGWLNAQAVSQNTGYSTQIVLTSNSTFNIIINGSTVVTGATPANNIVTKANKIRLEKSAQSTTLVYYGGISYTDAGVTTSIDYGQ